jgi:hypothetical protein
VNKPLGWTIILLSCAYAIWVLISFLIAVPLPSYIVPRAGLAACGLCAGVYQFKHKVSFIVFGALCLIGGLILSAVFVKMRM